MQNRIYCEEMITLLKHNAIIRVRVALPGQINIPAENRQYVEAELIAYYPETDYRAKYRGYAIVKDNEHIQPFGVAVQRRAGGQVKVNQLFLHPDDAHHLQRYCKYLNRPFGPLEYPTYGLRLTIEERQAQLIIRHLPNASGGNSHTRGDADFVIGVLIPGDGSVQGRLVNITKRLAGWLVYDSRERKKKGKRGE